MKATVLVDTAALFHAARVHLGGKINYHVLMDHVEEGYEVADARAYGMKVRGYEPFKASLQEAGFETLFKEPNKKGVCDWSVQMAMDAIFSPDDRHLVIAADPYRIMPLIRRLKDRITLYSVGTEAIEVHKHNIIKGDMLESVR